MESTNEDVVKTELTEDAVMAEASTEIKKKPKVGKPVRMFPQYSIREAMKIPQIIGLKNAGNPWSPENVANALDTSPQNNSFFYLSSASRDYGFTTGTSRAKTIELTALGRKLAFPESSDDESTSIFRAFSNIEVFKNVFDYYQESKFPEDKYLCNTLKESFDVDSTYHKEFLDIFKDNLKLINEKGYYATKVPRPTTSTTQRNPVQEENTKGDKEIFVIMPFSEKTNDYPKGYFEEVYSSLFVPAAAEVGFTAKTAKRSGSDVIHSTIVNDIYKADIVLADLTEHNPNVLFELGLAFAFKKKVALVRAKGTVAIFDVDNLMRVYDYDKNLWKSTIERDIPNISKHLESTMQSEGSLYLDLLLNKQ